MVGTNERGRYESTPLQLAAGSGKVEAIRALIAAGASLEADGPFSPLHMAAQDGHASAIKVLADAGASLEAVDKDGNTPLHEATGWGHVGAIKALVAAGASLEAKSDAGLTPLHVPQPAGMRSRCCWHWVPHIGHETKTGTRRFT